MLFTGKGDNGSTKTFGCDQRISKSSAVAEALGSLDETNSIVGLCKSKSKEFNLDGVSFWQICHDVQRNLFIIQAEVAGADKHIADEKIKEVEAIINSVEKILPPIKSFFIPGATEVGAYFDLARTISRRAERRVVAAKEEGLIKVGDNTLAYLNRLSSLLYALARLTNHKSGITEQSPDYR